MKKIEYVNKSSVMSADGFLQICPSDSGLAVIYYYLPSSSNPNQPDTSNGLSLLFPYNQEYVFYIFFNDGTYKSIQMNVNSNSNENFVEYTVQGINNSRPIRLSVNSNVTFQYQGKNINISGITC